MSATSSFYRALAAAVRAGVRTPCQRAGGDPWLSESAAERAEAAAACADCPLTVECLAAAREPIDVGGYRVARRVVFGVRGGVDFGEAGP